MEHVSTASIFTLQKIRASWGQNVDRVFSLFLVGTEEPLLFVHVLHLSELLFTPYADASTSMYHWLCSLADESILTCGTCASYDTSHPRHLLHSTSPHSHCGRTSLLLVSTATRMPPCSWCQRKCFFSTTCTLWSSSGSEHITTWCLNPL